MLVGMKQLLNPSCLVNWYNRIYVASADETQGDRSDCRRWISIRGSNFATVARICGWVDTAVSVCRCALHYPGMRSSYVHTGGAVIPRCQETIHMLGFVNFIMSVSFSLGKGPYQLPHHSGFINLSPLEVPLPRIFHLQLFKINIDKILSDFKNELPRGLSISICS